jgi:chromate transporter
MGGRFDVASAVIAAAAALSLIRFKRPVVQVIAACAVAGWALSVLA